MKLTLPTNRTKTGPRIQHQGQDAALSITYDHEADDGKITWITVSFAEPIDFEYRDESLLSAEDVLSAYEIAELTSSVRLRKTLEMWEVSVGRQGWQQSRGGAGRFKHYKIYFDDVGCVDVVAAGCQVTDEVHPAGC